MKKRRFIRSIFIGLLTLCIVVWVGSYWRALTIPPPVRIPAEGFS